MKRCLQLAKNGLGRTYPNPLVGCVIVLDDQIIGEGWHRQAGTPHAEVHAINSVRDKDQLCRATLYVNLEPCCHHGKTPPCSDLIIAEKIPRVVISNRDPNPKVSGKGIEKLRKAGVEVVTGCLEEEGTHLNRRFFTFYNRNRPYIILKWAQTTNGFIAPEKQKQGKPFWITGAYARQLVHKWRSEEQGILIGKNTAIKDNPRLNTRLWKGKNPTRILIDADLKSRKQQGLHLYDNQTETIVFCNEPRQHTENTLFEKLNPGENTVSQILERLYEHQLQSVIVEGGRDTLQRFIDAGLWDEARVFTGTSGLESGIKAPDFPFESQETYYIDNDILNIYRPVT